MASISDKLFDLLGAVPYAGAVVSAYLDSDQGIRLNNPDGSPIFPLGLVKAVTSTSSTGEYTLTGLVSGMLYDLWVEPTDQDPFWIPSKIPDVLVNIRPCILFGTLADTTNTDVVWAFLEEPSVLQGGLHLSQGVVFATISQFGAFSLALWPTQYLTPPSLYRVTLDKSVYRGSVPQQSTVQLSAWLALPTTQVL